MQQKRKRKEKVEQGLSEFNEILKSATAYLEGVNKTMDEVAKKQAENAKKGEETGRKIDKLYDSLKQEDGNFKNKWGRFMEDLVKGDLRNILKGYGMEVIRVLSRVPFDYLNGAPRGEVNLIAVNGGEIVAVDVKTTLTAEDVKKFLQFLGDFRIFFPEYSNKKIYGGVAGLRLQDDVNYYAEKRGLFVIKAPGGESKVSTLTNAKDFKPKKF